MAGRSGGGELIKDCENTLKRLNTSYLDAYLLHWPDSRLSLKEIVKTLKTLQSEGLIRQMGLSNVTRNHIKRAQELGMEVSWVQVEMHPFFYDASVVEFCKMASIGVQGWAPLLKGLVNRDPLLRRLGEKYGKTASQIALRWSVQNGCVPLPASQSLEHIKENLSILDFELSLEEMSLINERAEKGERKRITKESLMGFIDEFDFPYEKCWPN